MVALLLTNARENGIIIRSEHGHRKNTVTELKGGRRAQHTKLLSPSVCIKDSAHKMPEHILSPALRRSNKRRVDEPNTYKGFKKAKPSPSILCTGSETPELVEDRHGLCWMVSVFNLFTRAPFLRTLLKEDLIELIDNAQKSGVDKRILDQDRNSACPLLPADFVKFCARYDITINLGSWPMTFFWMLVTYSKQQVLTSGGYRITALRMLCLQDITKFGWYCDNTPYPTGFITNKQCTNTMEYKIVGHTESVG